MPHARGQPDPAGTMSTDTSSLMREQAKRAGGGSGGGGRGTVDPRAREHNLGTPPFGAGLSGRGPDDPYDSNLAADPDYDPAHGGTRWAGKQKIVPDDPHALAAILTHDELCRGEGSRRARELWR